MRRNRTEQMKSWVLKRHAQETFPSFFRFSSRALIGFADQPIRGMLFTDGPRGRFEKAD